MKKIVIIIFVLLLFSIFVYAQDEIFSAESAKINLNISSEVTIKKTNIDPKINQVQIILYLFPKEEINQKIKNIETNSEAKNYQDKIIFTWDFPKSDMLNFSYSADIETNNKFNHVSSRIKYPLPKDIISSDVLIFTELNQYIDSNNEIKQLAKNILGDETNQWIVVSKIGFWIRNNINCELNNLDELVSQKASLVLQNKKGNCNEINNLFIAILRAIDIPTRLIEGLSYKNNQQVYSHNWAEVYFHQVGWVPFDINYGEFGWIDVSHIKLRENKENINQNLEATSQGKDVELIINKLSFNTEIIETKGNNADLIINSNLFKRNIGVGSYNLIEIEVENTKDHYVTTELFLSKSNEFESIEGYIKQLILEPKQKQKLVWKIKVNDNLDKTKNYQIPIFINTIKNETSKNIIQVSSNENIYGIGDISKETALFLLENTKRYSKLIDVDCKPTNEKDHIDKEREIICEIKNNGEQKLKYISACIDHDCKDVEIEPKKSSFITFYKYFNKGGINEVLLTLNSQDITKKINFYIEVLDNPKIEITNIKYPEIIESEERFYISFILSQESYSIPKDIKISLQGLRNKEAIITQPELKDNQSFEFLLSEDQLYNDKLNLVVNYKYNDKEFQEIKEIKINIKKTGFFGSIWNFLKAFWRNIVDTFT